MWLYNQDILALSPTCATLELRVLRKSSISHHVGVHSGAKAVCIKGDAAGEVPGAATDISQPSVDVSPCPPLLHTHIHTSSCGHLPPGLDGC